MTLHILSHRCFDPVPKRCKQSSTAPYTRERIDACARLQSVRVHNAYVGDASTGQIAYARPTTPTLRANVGLIKPLIQAVCAVC